MNCLSYRKKTKTCHLGMQSKITNYMSAASGTGTTRVASITASAVPRVWTWSRTRPRVWMSRAALVFAAVAAGWRRQGPGPRLGVGRWTTTGLRIAWGSAAATARRDRARFGVAVSILKKHKTIVSTRFYFLGMKSKIMRTFQANTPRPT